MTFKRFLVVLCVFAYSFAAFCAEEEKEGLRGDRAPLSFIEAIQRSEHTAYLYEQPVAGLTGNVSGFISTDEPKKIFAILGAAGRNDLVFSDFDDVFLALDIDRTVDSSNPQFKLVSTDVKKIILARKRKSTLYLLSAGDNFAHEQQFEIAGTRINEPAKDANATYVDLFSDELADLNGVIPTMVCSDICKYIDYSRGGKFMKRPVLSIYPDLGAFQVNSAYWHKEMFWKDIPDEDIMSLFLIRGCDMFQLNILKYIYAGAPIKGRAMKSILTYLSRVGDCSAPRDIYFIDDNILICKAFLFYLRVLKRQGYFIGNIKVVHYTQVKKDCRFLENQIVRAVESLSDLLRV